MSRSLNRAMLIGNLGRDPEMRYSESGVAQVTLSVATSYSVKKGEEWEEKTEWHRVIQWGPKAEKTAEFYRKGNKVFVDGRIQTREYEKDGSKRFITEVIASDVIGMEPRTQSDGNYGDFSGNRAAPNSTPAVAAGSNDEFDDLPF